MTSLNVQYFKPYYVVSTNSSIFGLSQWQDHEGKKKQKQINEQDRLAKKINKFFKCNIKISRRCDFVASTSKIV